MYSAKRCQKIKIFTSKYIGEQKYYNFKSNDPKQFIFESFQCKYRNKLYLYQDQQQDIIVSTTMDISNQLDLIFGIEIRENETENIYHFKTADQIVSQNQRLLFCGIKRQRGQQRGQKLYKKRQNNRNAVQKLIKRKQALSNYYYPDLSLKNVKKQEIWLVPRYMGKLQLQQQMIIRFYKEKNQVIPKNYNNQDDDDDDDNFTSKLNYQEIQVSQLSFSYRIQEVNITDIKNNIELSQKNQMNLFHICDQYVQTKQVAEQDKITCYICLQSQQDKILQKRFPNLLFDPCGCTGGNKFAHLKCIITWINQNNIYDCISCKMCQKPFPQFVQINRIVEKNNKIIKYYRLIGGNVFPFIQFGDLQVKLNSNQEFFIGNDIRSSLKINLHLKEKQSFAKVEYDAKLQKAYICDLGTKYGTLVRKNKMINKISKSQSQQTCTLLIKNRLFNITLIFN